MVPFVVDQASDSKAPAGGRDGGADAVGAGPVVAGRRRDGRVEGAPIVTLGEARVALSHGLRDGRSLGLSVWDRVRCHAGDERDDGQEKCGLHFGKIDCCKYL